MLYYNIWITYIDYPRKWSVSGATVVKNWEGGGLKLKKVANRGKDKKSVIYECSQNVLEFLIFIA